MRTNSRDDGSVVGGLSALFGNKDLAKVMRSLATDLLLSCGVPGPAFSPFDYARALKIGVEYANIQADGVFITKSGERRRILLRHPEQKGKISSRRANFTLAHELGHFVMQEILEGSHAATKFRIATPIGHSSPVTDYEEERLCDIFASELLMPERFILKDLSRTGLSPDALLGHCDRYDVSLKAMLVRILTLTRHSVIGIIWLQTEQYFEVDWATPFDFKRAFLCDSGKTSVERASVAAGTQSGRDTVILNGKRMWGHCLSRRLTSNKILTLMFRGSTNSHFQIEKRHSTNARSSVLSPMPKQPFLPFAE